jgi:hypothetical protein
MRQPRWCNQTWTAGIASFGWAGEMIEFEVMVRPIKARGEENGNRIGPQLRLPNQAAGTLRSSQLLLMASPRAARLRRWGPCGKDRRAS